MSIRKIEIKVLVDDVAGSRPRGILGQHGLAMIVETYYDSNKRFRLLFDTGQEFRTLIHNANLLGENIQNINAIALSHRHYDHTGGLLGVLKHLNQKEGKVKIIAHPDILMPGVVKRKDKFDFNAGLQCSIDEIKEHADLILLNRPTEISEDIWWLGEIPRITSYEKPPKWSYTLTSDGTLVEDPLKDDSGIVIYTEKYGGIVITGCSHSGVVNIVKHAQKVIKDTPSIVIGGFHLIDADDHRINRTVKDLLNLGVKRVFTGHCTGIRGELKFLQEYGDNFRKFFSGYQLILE